MKVELVSFRVISKGAWSGGEGEFPLSQDWGQPIIANIACLVITGRREGEYNSENSDHI